MTRLECHGVVPVALVALALGATTTPVAAAPLYGPPYLSYPVGRGPTDLAVADLTDDGIFDVVTTDFLAGTVTLAAGLADGQFRPPVVLLEAPAPTSVLAQDLNFDGAPDLIVTCYEPEIAMVFRNAGDGVFTFVQTLDAPGGPIDAVLSDTNGDFRPDLVVVEFLNNAVNVFLSISNGRFVDTPNAVPVGTQPIAIVSGDLNGDGREDLVTANYGSANISLLSVDLAGVFRPAVPYPLPERPLDLVGRDMNGDGRLDLVVGFDSEGAVTSLRSDRGFSFENQTAYATGGTRVSGLELVDLNRDGIQDLVALDDARAGFRVLRGLGNGGFARWEENPGVLAPVAAGAADLNMDGVFDLVFAGARHGELGVHFGRANGRFGVERTIAGSAAPGLLSGDLDGDGLDDLVTFGTTAETAGLAVWRGGAVAGLVPPGAIPPPGPVEAAALAELTGDGRLDLAIVDAATRRIRILPGDGAGGFADGPTFPLPDHAAALVAADLTGDAWADLAVALDAQDRIALFVADASAPGGFAEPRYLGTGRTPRALAAADLDGDGHRELAVALVGSRRIDVFAGAVGGPVGAALPVVEGLTPAALAASDLDGDGLVDLVVAAEAPAELRLLRSAGGLAFTTAAVGAIGAGAADLVLADVNADGLPDYLTACRGPGVVTVWLAAAGSGLRSRADWGVGAGGAGALRALARGAGARPVLAVSAGLPGAAVFTLTAGDVPTPVASLEFAGERRGGAVHLTARLGGELRAGIARFERLEEQGGIASLCAVPLSDGRATCVDDAAPAGSVRYRIRVEESDGTQRLFPPIDVAAAPPAPPLVVTPNPARGPVQIAWNQAEAGPARFEVFDAAGRLVAAQDAGVLPFGPVTRAWDGRATDGTSLPAGHYWVRVTTGGRSVTRRLVRLP